jgi:hypothetical protein
LKKALSSNTPTFESSFEVLEVLSSLLLRLSQVENCLAQNLATQQRLEERLATLEQQQEVPTPDLKALSERVLAQLHLGKQAPGYKAAKKALLNFITEWKKRKKLLILTLADLKTWLFEFANRVNYEINMTNGGIFSTTQKFPRIITWQNGRCD